MKSKLQALGMSLSRIGLGTVALLTALVMLFIFLSSMLGTVDMSTDNPMKEKVTFQDDPFFMNLLLLVLSLLFGVLSILYVRVTPWGKRLTANKIAFGVGLWVFLAGSAWVLMAMSSPTEDSLAVTRAGIFAAMDDLHYLEEVYFQRFPFQTGYVLWTELWARVFDMDFRNYILLEILNVLCLAVGEWALVMTADRLFRRTDVTFATGMMLCLFFQPMLFSTFLYGNLPGFGFACLAVYFFVEYLRRGRWEWLVPSGASLLISIMLKLNNMILLVAMGIILLAHLLRGKPVRRALALILLCASVIPMTNLPKACYEARLGKDLGEGIPMTSWMAMGLNESPIAPGWYNGKYTVSNFHAVDMNTEDASENSKQVIKERLEHFKKEPAEALQFFKKKILSQWNETTFQSIWTNQVRGQFMTRIGLAKYACEEGEDDVKAVMDGGVQFIYFGMTVASFYLLYEQYRKKEHRRSVEPALYLIPLIILGGFLYHALFEAKSQYAITYVILMIPYAAWGACKLASTCKLLLFPLYEKYVGKQKKLVRK